MNTPLSTYHDIAILVNSWADAIDGYRVAARIPATAGSSDARFRDLANGMRAVSNDIIDSIDTAMAMSDDAVASVANDNDSTPKVDHYAQALDLFAKAAHAGMTAAHVMSDGGTNAQVERWKWEAEHYVALANVQALLDLR